MENVKFTVADLEKEKKDWANNMLQDKLAEKCGDGHSTEFSIQDDILTIRTTKKTFTAPINDVVVTYVTTNYITTYTFKNTKGEKITFCGNLTYLEYNDISKIENIIQQLPGYDYWKPAQNFKGMCLAINETIRNSETKLQRLFQWVAYYALLLAILLIVFALDAPDENIGQECLYFFANGDFEPFSLVFWYAFSFLFPFFECYWYYKLYKMNKKLAEEQHEKRINNTNLFALIISTLLVGIFNIVIASSEYEIAVLQSIIYLFIVIFYIIFLFRVANDINTRWKVIYGVPNLPYSLGNVLKFYAIGKLAIWCWPTILPCELYETATNNIMDILTMTWSAIFFYAISLVSLPLLHNTLVGKITAKDTEKNAGETEAETTECADSI